MQLLCVAITFLLFCAGIVSAKTPLPEFFGVYALYDGKLIELQSHPQSQLAISGMTMMGADVISQLSGITFPEGTIEFIIFRDSATTFNKIPLSKIARINVESNSAWGGDGRKKRLRDRYHLMPEEVYMNVAPLKEMMVRVVPKNSLSRGIWAIKIGSELYDFVVGSEESADCVIRKVGATGVKYIPCSKGQKVKKGGKHKNRYAAVLHLANFIKDARSKALALAGVATELAKAGNKKKSGVVFSEAIEIARSIKEEDRDKTWVLAGIATELAKAGDKKKSEVIFSEAMEIAGSIKDAKLKARALGSIAIGLTKTGKIEKAIKIADSAKYVFVDIATELTKAGEIEKAIKIADSNMYNKHEAFQAVVLAGIASELAKAGNNKKAEVVFSKAIEVADSIKDAAPNGAKGLVLAKIAPGLAKIGKIKKSLEMADSIKGALRKSVALAGIASELAKAGDNNKSKVVFFEAIEIADSIKYEGTRAEALVGIATELAKAGKVRKAIETAFFLNYTYYEIYHVAGLQDIVIQLAKLKTKDKQEDAEIANSIMTALNR